MKKDTKSNKSIVPYSRDVQIFTDDRGVFAPFISFEDSKKEIKRIYYVYNNVQGTIRGFHFHKKEWKYFTIVQGAAKFVAVDPENTKKMYTFYSSTRKPTVVIIPPGFANGWVSFENGTILLCASTATIEESLADDTRFDPYTWGDVWSIKAR